MLFRDGRNSSSPAHWSKDFVEHLRTVHFTLIGIAIGLIVIVLSAKPYNPAVALRQIHEILELKKMWSANWLMRKGIKKARTSSSDEGESGKDNKDKDLSTIGEVAEWNRDPMMPDSTTSESSTSAPDLDSMGNFPILPNIPFFGQVKSQGRSLGIGQFSIQRFWYQGHTTPDWSPEQFPTTLSDFRQWWDTLQKHDYKAIFPRTIYLYDGRCFTVASTAEISLIGEPKAAVVTDKIPLDLEVFGNSVAYKGDGNFGMCLFPIRRFVYVDISQRNVVTQFSNWRVGAFDTSFPDLAQAAHDLATLELDDIEKFIAGEAAKGTEVFEAFGMKFPAGQITLWGIIVLLGVQLYFFVYLKQLSGKLGPTDAGWDVPWIGMTTAPLAQVIYFITVLFLPLMATVLLGRHTISHFGKPIIPNGWVIAEVLGLIGALISTLILGGLSWKYRPKLQPTVELPSQNIEPVPTKREPPAISE